MCWYVDNECGYTGSKLYPPAMLVEAKLGLSLEQMNIMLVSVPVIFTIVHVCANSNYPGETGSIHSSMSDFPASPFIQLKRLFVCFVAYRPKSTAMVIAGRSVRLTTLFPGQA